MTRHSIRWRLSLIGGLAIIATMGLSILGLTFLFDRHVQRVAVADLKARVFTVAALVDPGGEDGPVFREAAGDPLYDQPFSGHYWQLALGQEVRRSRSLWDYAFSPAETVLPAGSNRVLDLNGPLGEPLLAVEQWLEVGSGATAAPMRVIVARDRQELENARRGFLSDILPYLAVLGGLLVGASWVQITLGMRPLSTVSDRVATLRSGRTPRIGGDLPLEVLPLAGEIDQLLDERDKELLRARNRAADLAHGLKTPLQALLGDAAQLRDKGETDVADSIEAITAAMRRLVDRELARARIQSGRSATTASPARVARRVIDVLARTPLGAGINWTLDIPAELRMRIDEDDLTEAVGALTENAVRHARSEVFLRAWQEDGWIVLSIRDDGPGAPTDALELLAKRGVRLDEQGDGHGIGLAIVADIADAAGGEFQLKNTHPGLEATLRLNGT